MTGLDYAEALRLHETFGLEGGCDLELGRFRLAALPFPVLRSLAGKRRIAAEILSDCFVHRPVMWDEPDRERRDHSLDSLRRLERDLITRARILESSGAPDDHLLASILDRWADLTADACRRLRHASEPGAPLGLAETLGSYRRAAYAPISAMIQILGEGDDTARRAQARMREGKAAIVRFCGVSPDDIEEAAWSLTGPDADVDDPTMVTWGIP